MTRDGWGEDDWIGLVVVLAVYVPIIVTVWRVGLRRSFQWLRDALEALTRRLIEGAERTTEALETYTEGRCTCHGGRLVSVYDDDLPEPVVTAAGDLVGWVCPTCLGPTRAPFVPPVMALELLDCTHEDVVEVRTAAGTVVARLCDRCGAKVAGIA